MAKSNGVIWIAFGLVIAIFIFACLVKSKFIADMLSPVGIKEYLYGNENNNNGRWSVIAYALGTVFFSGVFISVVTNFLKTLGDRYLSGTLGRYAWKKHVLFVGYDELMIGTLRDRCAANELVIIAIPGDVLAVRNSLNGLLQDKEMKRVELVQCNSCDKECLERRARAQKAKQIFIIGQPNDATHDASNFKSMDVLSELVKDSSKVDCRIYIRNQSSFSLIQRQGWQEENGTESLRHYAMPFNFHENIASKVLTGFDSGKPLMTLDYHDAKRNLAVCPSKQVHLVIVGMTEMGMTLAREVLMVMHYPKHRISITMVDERAREEMFYFIGRYKELFKQCRYSFVDLDGKEESIETKNQDKNILDVDMEFIQTNPAHPRLTDLIETWVHDDSRLLTMAICTNNSPRNMAIALYLPYTFWECESIPVWVYQHGDDSLKEFSSHKLYKNLHVFSANEYGNLDDSGNMMMKWSEQVAKAYVQSSMSTKKAGDWAKMSQYARWSSLHNVRSVIAKLRGIGYELSMVDGKMSLERFGEGTRTSCKELKLTYDEIMELSDTEHIRWMVDTLAKGFRPTTDDEHAKILAKELDKDTLKETVFAHDDIRPYAELIPETAAYDVDMTRAMVYAINEALAK